MYQNIQHLVSEAHIRAINEWRTAWDAMLVGIQVLPSGKTYLRFEVCDRNTDHLGDLVWRVSDDEGTGWKVDRPYALYGDQEHTDAWIEAHGLTWGEYFEMPDTPAFKARLAEIMSDKVTHHR